MDYKIMDYNTEKIGEKTNHVYEITNGQTSLVIDLDYSFLGLSKSKSGYTLYPNTVMSYDEFDKWIGNIDLSKVNINIDLPFFPDKEKINSAMSRHSCGRSERLAPIYTKRLYKAFVALVSKDFWTHIITTNTPQIPALISKGLSRIFEAFLEDDIKGDAVCSDMLDVLKTSTNSYIEAYAYVDSFGRTKDWIDSKINKYIEIGTFCKKVIHCLRLMTFAKNNLNMSANKDLTKLIKFRVLGGYRAKHIRTASNDFYTFINEKQLWRFFNDETLNKTPKMSEVIAEYSTSTAIKTDPIIWASLLTDTDTEKIIKIIELNFDRFGYSEEDTLKAFLEVYLLRRTYVLEGDDEDFDDVVNIVAIADEYKAMHKEIKKYEADNSISIFYNRYSSVMEQKLDNGYYLKLPKDKDEYDEMLELLDAYNDGQYDPMLFYVNPLEKPICGIGYTYSGNGYGLLQGFNCKRECLTKKEDKILTEELYNIKKVICPN